MSCEPMQASAAHGAATAAAVAATVAQTAHQRALFSRQKREIGRHNMAKLFEMAADEEAWHRDLDRKAATTKSTARAAWRTKAQRNRAIAASASASKHREALDVAIKERFKTEAATAAATKSSDHVTHGSIYSRNDI